jgi:protein SCO1/2
MKKKLLLIGVSFIVLLAAFYLVLFANTDYYKAKLPVMTYVKDFSFTDQDGKPLTQRNVEGKVYVTEYFFTTCKGICPKMNANMKIIYEKYKSEPDFAIISHTCQPEVDSVPLLKAYSKTMDAGPNWYFVTGNKDSLYRMARESYLLDNEKNTSMNIQEQFIHTQFFAVVDKEARVRGVYDALKMDEVDKLSRDIKDLLKEKKTPATFNNSTFRNTPN